MSLFACQSIHQEDPEDERFFILYGFGCSISRSVNISGGGSRIFFWRGCTRLFLYFNTNKPHSFFGFFAEYQLYQLLENRRSSPGGGGGGGAPPRTPCTLPLDPPLISRRCEVIYQILLHGESIFFAHSAESICQAKILLFGVNCRL